MLLTGRLRQFHVYSMSSAMTKLSPEAQSVMDATWKLLGQPAHRKVLAVAIRAALDVTLPEFREHHPITPDERYRKVSAFDIRNRFLSLAAELERGYE